MVTILNTTEMCTLKWLTLCYMNFILVKYTHTQIRTKVLKKGVNLRFTRHPSAQLTVGI